MYISAEAHGKPVHGEHFSFQVTLFDFPRRYFASRDVVSLKAMRGRQAGL